MIDDGAAGRGPQNARLVCFKDGRVSRDGDSDWHHVKSLPEGLSVRLNVHVAIDVSFPASDSVLALGRVSIPRRVRVLFFAL